MEKLKRTKSAIKCSITKLEGFIGDNPDAKTTNISQLEVKLNKVKNLQQKLEELRDNYYDIQDLPNLQEIEQDIEEISDRLENVEVSLKLLLASFKAEVINISHTNESSKEVKTKVRLPEIPLPSFSGSYAEFNNFKIQFINLIDKNEQLDDSQKLYYLKAALKAEARLLEAADDNYNSLFQALIRRYENKRLVIDAHISEILNFEKIHHESVKELRNFIDCINKNVRALKVLEYSQNDLSEAILINVILNKLDKESQKQFELSLETTSVPKFEYLMSFLEKKSSVLENLTRNNPSQIKSFKITNTKGSINKSKTLIVNENKTNIKPCICCFQQHPLFRCKAFINLSVTNRKEFVNKNKLCINCLRKHKGVCNSKFQCRNCNLFHNTLLCENKIDEKNQLENETKAVSVSAEINHIPQAEAKTFLANDNKNKFVLLNTALIYIRNQEGKKVRLRCLLDSASTINIITEKAAKLINNKLIPIKSSVTGINCFSEPIKNVLNAQLSNEDGSFSRNVEFAVLQKITSDVPVTKLDISNLIIPPGIKLADNNFHIPSPIDALIGSELFFDILKGDKINLGEGNCTLVATRFGYLVAGTLPQADNSSFCCLLNTVSLDNTLKKFFELEALPGDNKDLLKSEEELFCEEHFKRTYKRDKSGRFIVQLPIKENAEVLLGDSKENAIKRLNHIWAKLDKNNTMANLYREFLEEYENLGHMKEINFENSSNTSYFIPHHAVHRPESLSTPLRVVFNASASTSTGYSLNSLLLNGGNIQQDLFSIVTRFRTHKYAFCADIKKCIDKY